MLNLESYQLFLENEKKNQQKIRLISMSRLLIGILMVIFLVCFFTLNYEMLYLLFFGISLAALIVISIFAKPIYIKERYYKNFKVVLNKHENRRKNNFKSVGFFDNGKEFKRAYLNDKESKVKYLVEDIDLFGPNSLYQNISNCYSVLGRNELADSLVHSEQYYENRKEWPSKVKKLGNDENFLYLETALMFNKIEEDIDVSSYKESFSQKFMPKKNKFIGLIFIFLLDILIITLSALNIIPIFSIMFVLIINLYYSSLFKDPIDIVNATKISASISQIKLVLNSLSKLDISYIDDKYQKKYFDSAAKTLNKTYVLWQIMSFKNNIIFKLLANGLFMFEGIFQLIYNKLMPDDRLIIEILEDIATIENISSLATLVSDYDTCIPEYGDLEFEELANPLVKNCVPNSLKYNIPIIITGSNMSGKTTFLRTIITNIILFNLGGNVLARSFKSKNYAVFTSLRIKDELSMGVSTFYAEINKIKEMIKTDTKYEKLCVIDEIFKGTNTLDRIYGATKLIEKLKEIGAKFLVSTHDFELCDLDGIVNYHFSELYDDDYKHISFDYLLKEGRSKSTNAIFLLKSAGVIE